MLEALLLAHWILTPIFCTLIIQSLPWACIFTFTSVFAFWGVNRIASEIESPFGDDPNDLPLHELQKDMNKSLWILLHPCAQAVPKFTFDPEVHRKWDVVCEENFAKTSSVAQRLFRPHSTRTVWSKVLSSSKFSGGSSLVGSEREVPQSTYSASSSAKESFRLASMLKRDAGDSPLPKSLDDYYSDSFFTRTELIPTSQLASEGALSNVSQEYTYATQEYSSTGTANIPSLHVNGELLKSPPSPRSQTHTSFLYERAKIKTMQPGRLPATVKFAENSIQAVEHFIEKHISQTIRELQRLQASIKNDSRALQNVVFESCQEFEEEGSKMLSSVREGSQQVLHRYEAPEIQAGIVFELGQSPPPIDVGTSCKSSS